MPNMWLIFWKVGSDLQSLCAAPSLIAVAKANRDSEQQQHPSWALQKKELNQWLIRARINVSTLSAYLSVQALPLCDNFDKGQTYSTMVVLLQLLYITNETATEICFNHFLILVECSCWLRLFNYFLVLCKSSFMTSHYVFYLLQLTFNSWNVIFKFLHFYFLVNCSRL